MQMMVEGDLWEMYIPSDLGYGDHGSPPKIGGGDALIFKMEIVSIEGEGVPAITCDPSTLKGAPLAIMEAEALACTHVHIFNIPKVVTSKKPSMSRKQRPNILAKLVRDNLRKAPHKT